MKHHKYPEEVKADNIDRMISLEIGPAALIALNEMTKAMRENETPSPAVDRLVEHIGKDVASWLKAS